VSHGHSHSAGARHAGRLWIAFGLTAAFLVVQVVTGLATGSLALLSDAGHMATDVLGLGMALAAITLARRGSTASHRTFGWYRLEIVAALANAMLLIAVAVWVVVEALGRFGDPPEIDGRTVLVVGVIGLAVNLVAFALLREGRGESLNVEGAYLEVLADLLGSVAMTAELRSIPNVTDVHDVHVWTLTSGMDVATAHLRVGDNAHSHQVLDDARQVLATRHGIRHATLQVEPADHTGCEEVSW
jgi:cobalt-zinc-cadmium efflux system protein